jgi:capsular exopolysaccharide synthesis family protein
VKLIEEAYAVKTRDEASRFTTAGMTGLGMFGLCVLGVSFLEFRARRVSGFSEVAYGLGLKIVGVLPQVPVRALGHKSDKAPDNWQHILTESIASTRTMLIHAAKNESLRVVMVSSAMKGEGKTLVSSHLAVSMALAGFKTLLIDADLRCPSVHRLFDLPQSPGLSDLLRAQARSKKVLHSGKVPGLTIMTAGQWDNALVQLLAQQRVGEVLAVLRKSYDFIIIDSAPILAASDTSLIAQHTDGVLLSVLCDVSRLPMVHLAYERMAMLGVRTLGAVVGGANLDSYGYGYAYGPPTSSM